MPFYRIAWRSLLTDARGCGEFIFTDKKDVEKQVEDLNKRYIHEITHWVECDQDVTTPQD